MLFNFFFVPRFLVSTWIGDIMYFDENIKYNLVWKLYFLAAFQQQQNSSRIDDIFHNSDNCFCHFDNWKDNPGDLWHLRHWLQFWQLRIWIHDNLCYLTINCDTGQHSQFLQCFYHLDNCKDYTSDNWEPEFMTVFVTWQFRVSLDSIHAMFVIFFLQFICLRLRLGDILVQAWCA